MLALATYLDGRSSVMRHRRNTIDTALESSQYAENLAEVCVGGNELYMVRFAAVSIMGDVQKVRDECRVDHFR